MAAGVGGRGRAESAAAADMSGGLELPRYTKMVADGLLSKKASKIGHADR
jgi:hypothetical protein